ncbi:protein of unknown function [Candidatus Filomicrobium marinum]|uniref:Uncharacterized protein n=1 Tax=Candidatus Filomicrobium marinum TaxID=1608628 RepID=A0A0D6JGQ8_9HYPH|nr:MULTISPECIES: hypothetical protein [Filomicrobium]MCV0369694.1 hypothetical protein [Filomicrobium sp.]CFX48059.1 protein of unknown function [Candidatus Filomicrobium marinum]CPR20468.1 protein of unknown function [Candidatus Filomicrobium marinum]
MDIAASEAIADFIPALDATGEEIVVGVVIVVGADGDGAGSTTRLPSLAMGTMVTHVRATGIAVGAAIPGTSVGASAANKAYSRSAD